MAGFASSPKNNRTLVVKVPDKKKFVEEANQNIPSKEFFDINKKAGKLIGIKK